MVTVVVPNPPPPQVARVDGAGRPTVPVVVYEQKLLDLLRAIGAWANSGGGAGGSSAGTFAFSLVSDATMQPGIPVAVSRSTQHLIPARADTYTSAFVTGVMASAVASSFAGSVEGGVVSLTDWTAATGAASLLPGRNYYLAPSGGLTFVQPTLPGQSVVIVGEAIDPQTLLVTPTRPVLL